MQITDELETLLYKQELRIASSKVRRSRTKMAEMLSQEFTEFGASGRVFTKEQILDLLQAGGERDNYHILDFRCRQLGSDSVLVTYRILSDETHEKQRPGSLRSSIWIRENDDKWRLFFHQGTRC